MKTSTKIIWGIIILLFAIGLLFYAIMPTLAIFTVSIWKWFILAILIYWVIKLVFFSKPIANKLSCIFPLSLIFIIFENDIAKLIGQKPDFVNRWIVVASAALIVVAVQLIFHKSGNSVNYTHSSTQSSQSTSQTTNQTYQSTYTKKNDDGVEYKSFSMGGNTYYIDASKQTSVNLKNAMGELNVYFQNTDLESTSDKFELCLKNSFGQTNISVPYNWKIVVNDQNSAFGEINVRPNQEITTKTLILNLKNAFGEIDVK